LRWLINHGFIDVKKQYIVGRRSRRYRPTLQSADRRDVAISAKRLRRLSWNQKSNACSAVELITLRQHQGLCLDFDLAARVMSGLSSESRDAAVSAALDFRLKDYWACERQNTGRVYSTITNMNKTLRPCVSWDGQKVVSLDVVNSQPLWLAALSNCNEFRQVVQAGSIYEMIQDFAGLDGRSSAKKAFMAYAYGPHNTAPVRFSGRTCDEIALNADQASQQSKQTCRYWGNPVFGELRSRVFPLFRDSFPEVHETLRQMKSGKKPKSYAQASLALSRAEADTVIHKCLVPLAALDFPVLSIHDCLLTTSERSGEVRQFMEDRLCEELSKRAGQNMTAQIEMKAWNEPSPQPCPTQTTIT
jgi:hypothetical protein